MSAVNALPRDLRETIIDNDGYALLRAVIEGRPYFGPRHASLQGNPVRHCYMTAVVDMLARAGRRSVDILEAGSWAGGSAITWARALDQFGLQGHVFCVDHWRQEFDLDVNRDQVYASMVGAVSSGVIERLFQHNVEMAGVANRVVRLSGTTRDVLPELATAGFDIVFIDASHLYEDVREDLRHAVRLVRRDGVLCGDDLEIEATVCDPGALELAIAEGADYVRDPSTGLHYHPGVTKAVSAALGHVGIWSGFWATMNSATGWAPVTLPTVSPEPPQHLARCQTDEPLRVSSAKGFTIIDTSQVTIAIADGLTPEDLLWIPRHAWAGVPLVLTGGAEEVRRQLGERLHARVSTATAAPRLPVLVKEDHHGFNIVDVHGRFFAVPQALGPIDFSEVDADAMVRSHDALVADTLADVELLVAGLRARDQVHALEASLSTVRQVIDARAADYDQLRIAHAAAIASIDALTTSLGANVATIAQLTRLSTSQREDHVEQGLKLEQSVHDVALLRQALEEREREVGELRLELDRASRRAADVRSQLDAVVHERANLGTQLHEAQLANDAANTDVARLVVEAQVLREWIADLRERVTSQPTWTPLLRMLRRRPKVTPDSSD